MSNAIQVLQLLLDDLQREQYDMQGRIIDLESTNAILLTDLENLRSTTDYAIKQASEASTRVAHAEERAKRSYDALEAEREKHYAAELQTDAFIVAMLKSDGNWLHVPAVATIDECILAGRKIEAIKQLRAALHLSLKTAKEIVELRGEQIGHPC